MGMLMALSGVSVIWVLGVVTGCVVARKSDPMSVIFPLHDAVLDVRVEGNLICVKFRDGRVLELDTTEEEFDTLGKVMAEIERLG